MDTRNMNCLVGAYQELFGYLEDERLQAAATLQDSSAPVFARKRALTKVSRLNRLQVNLTAIMAAVEDAAYEPGLLDEGRWPQLPEAWGDREPPYLRR